MIYTPQAIANYFLDKADAEGVAMSPLKLLKLIYIAYGWAMALLGRKIFNEPIQAWQHGPVVPSIYHEFKHFGKRPITERATELDLKELAFIVPHVDDGDDEVRFVLDKVWASYRRFSGWNLRNKTHEKGSPWDKVYVEGRKDVELRDDQIAEHYQERIKRYLDA